jgi:hypothetical protein
VRAKPVLSYDIWDEYTRRQYLSKAPHHNPYGDDEEPKRFRQFDIFTKIRVLHQLTVWTFWNPDRLREKMPEHPRESDQTEWVCCSCQLADMTDIDDIAYGGVWLGPGRPNLLPS